MKLKREKKFNVRKAAELWGFSSVASYKEAQQNGQLALYICSDMERRNG